MGSGGNVVQGDALMTMGQARRLAVGLALAATMASPARAAPPISVWFHGSDGCPSGDAFLAHLSEHGVEGRIASVGDHIDFVVTLGEKDGESSATLERQSSQGTVALRELHGATCEAVAEALALTLALTVDPDAAPSAADQTSPGQGAPTATRVPPPSASAKTAGPVAQQSDVAAARDRIGDAGAGGKAKWLIGLEGTATSIVSGAALWGAAGFLELHAANGLRSSARLSLLGGAMTGPTPNVHMNLIAGRVDGCPVFFGTTLRVGGCAGFELGRLAASSTATGGESDAKLWAALWGIARVRYVPTSSRFSAEIQGALIAPLTRYRVTGEQPPHTLAEVKPVGVGLAAGGALSWQ
jgi:hypothetical protein